MDVKCTVCGYSNKNTSTCVRCKSKLYTFVCSGNCSSCLLSKKDNKEKINKICSI